MPASIQHVGHGHLFRTYSNSRPGLVHWTYVTSNGVAECTCEGWVNHRKCWHVVDAREFVLQLVNESDNETIDPFEGLGDEGFQVNL